MCHENQKVAETEAVIRAEANMCGDRSPDLSLMWNESPSTRHDEASGDELKAFDPASGKTVRSIDVAAHAGAAFDGQNLFQLAEDRIQKTDPKTGRVLATIPALGGGGDSGLAWAEGTLWVGQYRDRKIHQIDPQTGAILRTIESNRFVTGVTWIDGELWHGTWEGDESDLRRVDPRTGEVLERLDMPPGVGVSGLESDGGDQFFCGGGRSGKVRTVRRPKPSVVYAAAAIERPGVIRHIEGNRFSLAEIDGSKSERILRVSEAFGKAGFKAPVVSDVRAEIWTKLWGNSSFNPISALTHATLEDVCKFGPTRALAMDMMRETQAIGEALGVRFRISLEKRIAGAEAVGAHKTSMLQDIETGRVIEADALIGSVIELGRIVRVATPHMDAIYAAVKLLGETVTHAKGRLVVTRA
jgi:hypothetical protein